MAAARVWGDTQIARVGARELGRDTRDRGVLGRHLQLARRLETKRHAPRPPRAIGIQIRHARRPGNLAVSGSKRRRWKSLVFLSFCRATVCTWGVFEAACVGGGRAG